MGDPTKTHDAGFMHRDPLAHRLPPGALAAPHFSDSYNHKTTSPTQASSPGQQSHWSPEKRGNYTHHGTSPPRGSSPGHQSPEKRSCVSPARARELGPLIVPRPPQNVQTLVYQAAHAQATDEESSTMHA